MTMLLQYISRRVACTITVLVCMVLLNMPGAEQTLVFLVTKPCIKNPGPTRTYDFHVNCTVTLTCQYFHCQDDFKDTHHLVISPVAPDRTKADIREVRREPQKCLLEVELSNMQPDADGSYNCRDENSTATAIAVNMEFSPLSFLIRQQCLLDKQEDKRKRKRRKEDKEKRKRRKEDKEKGKLAERTHTFYAHEGCKVDFFCQYDDPARHCQTEGSKYSSKLNITAPNDNILRFTQNKKDECSVKARIRSVTVRHEGSYTCGDKNRGLETERILLRVGSKPVKPQNVTAVYRPNKYIRLLFDKVKAGEDLNDNQTEWIVLYSWTFNRNPCSSKTTSPNRGLYVACELDLTNKYNGGGAYSGLGSILNNISFLINATNHFGDVAVVKHFYLPHYIEPEAFRRVSVEEIGPTWILLRVAFPLRVDYDMCNVSQPDRDSALRIHYVATLLSEREQQDLQPETAQFLRKYNLYRNLPDDKRARDDLAEADGREYAVEAGTVLWSKSCNDTTTLNISGLHPFSFYRIQLTPQARYRGLVNEILNVTLEGTPLEGPQFDDSFYSCERSSEPGCIKCYVYFKEIPRPLRRARIQNYTLNGHKIDGGTTSNCHNADQFNVSVDGQHNTVAVDYLSPSATYFVQLQAFAKTGPSPVTNAALKTLRFSDENAGPHVIVRRGEREDSVWLYNVTWRPRDGTTGIANNDTDVTKFNTSTQIEVNHTVYYCFAKDKHHCMTNMVKTTHRGRQSGDSVVNVPVKVNDTAHLKPFFFVPTNSPSAPRSLTPAACLYNNSRVLHYPDLKITADANTLVLNMSPFCGQDYTYGRPTKFCYNYTEMENDVACRERCSIISTATESCTAASDEGVSIHESRVKPGTSYCVAVRSKGQGESTSKWHCQHITTAEGVVAETEKQILNSVLAVTIVVFVAVVIFFLCVKLYCCYQERKEKFGLSKQAQANSQRNMPKPPQKTIPLTDYTSQPVCIPWFRETLFCDPELGVTVRKDGFGLRSGRPLPETPHSAATSATVPGPVVPQLTGASTGALQPLSAIPLQASSADAPQPTRASSRYGTGSVQTPQAKLDTYAKEENELFTSDIDTENSDEEDEEESTEDSETDLLEHHDTEEKKEEETKVNELFKSDEDKRSLGRCGTALSHAHSRMGQSSSPSAVRRFGGEEEGRTEERELNADRNSCGEEGGEDDEEVGEGGGRREGIGREREEGIEEGNRGGEDGNGERPTEEDQSDFADLNGHDSLLCGYEDLGLDDDAVLAAGRGCELRALIPSALTAQSQNLMEFSRSDSEDNRLLETQNDQKIDPNIRANSLTLKGQATDPDLEANRLTFLNCDSCTGHKEAVDTTCHNEGMSAVPRITAENSDRETGTNAADENISENASENTSANTDRNTSRIVTDKANTENHAEDTVRKTVNRRYDDEDVDDDDADDDDGDLSSFTPKASMNLLASENVSASDLSERQPLRGRLSESLLSQENLSAQIPRSTNPFEVCQGSGLYREADDVEEDSESSSLLPKHQASAVSSDGLQRRHEKAKLSERQRHYWKIGCNDKIN